MRDSIKIEMVLRARMAGRSMESHDGSATAMANIGESSVSDQTFMLGCANINVCVIGQPKM
ncbi:MAG: hypothetical protein J0G33_05670 [Afipia felis]|nr:hypothetical protein [Afipia felis]MBE0704393.1 hypothetical protein [Afipia sp.]MBN9602402.1 hypothetical protein [Afipia felis]